MTDKEKLAKLIAEIKRLYNQSLADENRQADRGLELSANVSYGKSKACKELLSFIDSLPEEPESHYKGEDKKAVSEDNISLIRRYKNGYEAHYIDRTLHGKTYRMEGNPTGLVALPEEKIMLLTRDWTVVVFLEDLADLNRIECELNLHRI